MIGQRPVRGILHLPSASANPVVIDRRGASGLMLARRRLGHDSRQHTHRPNPDISAGCCSRRWLSVTGLALVVAACDDANAAPHRDLLAHPLRTVTTRRPSGRANLRNVVTESDRAKMRRLALDLVDGESDDRGTPEQRRRILETINADRRRQGLEPLTERAPEEGLYERARSLGMARVDR